jgi:CHAT domain-containing protein
VLRVLERFTAAGHPPYSPVVFGPEFPVQEERIADLLHSAPLVDLLTTAEGAPSDEVTRASMVHFLCHGHYDPADPWSSGFQFRLKNGSELVVEGRRLAAWRLRATLTVLEACDTRRQSVSVTDDGFGIGRFLHLAGVPTLMLADWEVRSDVSLVFMKAFYDALPSSNGIKLPVALGGAYKKAMSATRDKYGADQFFLWAPFTLVGAIH